MAQIKKISYKNYFHLKPSVRILLNDVEDILKMSHECFSKKKES
jgi:hypothetical protein